MTSKDPVPADDDLFGAYSVPRAETRFGQIALAKGYLSAAGLEECLKEQQRLRGAGRDVPLGQLLLDRNLLSRRQFESVVGVQKKEERRQKRTARKVLQEFLPETRKRPKKR